MEYQIYEDGKSCFLRIGCEEPMENLFELKMIMNNQPEGFLRMHITETGEGMFFDYNVSGLESLKACPDEALQGSYLKSIIFRLEELGEILKEYMLQGGRVELSEETIFLQRETGRVFFCYNPGKKKTMQESLRGLMEYFMKKICVSEEREVLLLYGLYAKSRENQVTFHTLADFWRENAGEEEILSEANTPGRIFEDDRKIYNELGLETFQVAEETESRHLLKKKRGGEETEKALLLLPDAGSELREDYGEIEDFDPDLYLEEKNFFRKITGAVRSYLFEIVVGIIVIAGTIMILLR